MIEKYKIKNLFKFYLPMVLLQSLFSTACIYTMVNNYYKNGFKFIDIPSLMFYPSIIYLFFFILLYFIYVFSNGKTYELEVKNTNIFIHSLVLILCTIGLSFGFDYLYFFFIDNNINNEIVTIAIENIDRITTQNQQEQIDEFKALKNSPFFIFSSSFYLTGMCIITPLIIVVTRKIFTKNENNI
jgi:hypothetical protein